MNALTRAIAVLAALNLLISGLALAQDPSEGEMQDGMAARAEPAARQAQEPAEVARKQAADAALQRLKTLEQAELAKSMLASRTQTVSSRNRWPFQSGGAGPVLVIPSAEIETKDLLTINEDLNVMSRLFEANLQKARVAPLASNVFLDRHARSSLLQVLTSRGNESIQSLYLQGYGVLFLMNVDFPLSPPSQVQEQDEAEKKEGGDRVWEDMRRQLYEPETLAKSKTDDSAEKYDAEKVENLKTTLIEALKHAANIRNLRPDESVIITVTGSGDFADQTMITTRRWVVLNGHKRIVQEPASDAAGWPTIIVIRAKKADIDGFAKGDLDLEQFRQRVQTLSYPYLEAETQRAEALDAYFRHVAPSNPAPLF